MNKRILVTGGCGFIGSHLVEHLVDACGDYVLAVDDLSTGKLENLTRHVKHRDRFDVEVDDVAEPSAWDLADVYGRFDQVYHLACPASPVAYQKRPADTARTAAVGTFRALEYGRQMGARVLVASTSEVYGDPQVHPQREDYWGHVNPIGARSCYDEGKRFAEALAVSHAAQYGVEVRIARLFNTYGPRLLEDDGRVVSTFIRQALSGEPVTLHGGGSQTRSFCYVSDAVDGLVRLMASGERRPVNIGNPEEITMRQLAEMIAGLCGATLRIAPHPLPADDPQRRRPDITRAMEVLGWRPLVRLADGLKKTIGEFREQRAA